MLAGLPDGWSLAMKRPGWRALCNSDKRPDTPARWDWPTSRVCASFGSARAPATMLAHCRSEKGARVVASTSERTPLRGLSPSASRAASTAIVTLSSSQLQ